MHSPLVQRLIRLALDEDIGPGDITTDPLVPPEARGRGTLIAKQRLVVAGLDVVRQVFEMLDPEVRCRPACSDGDVLDPGAEILAVNGRLRSLLTGERTALNFLQRLSGVATHVRTFVEALGDSPARLVDTRKTTPGLRALEKYAVRVGGAANHRHALYDGVLIKDNHIACAGGVEAAVALARRHASHLVKIEIEVGNQKELDAALRAGADVIMLDNMNLEQVRHAVRTIAGRATVEVSGGVRREDLAALAATGVDLISVGALTHGAVNVDISMRIAPAA